MDSLDRRARPHQQRLVEVLRERGVHDPAVLRAFAEVPRHRYADRFWAAPRGVPPEEATPREWVVGRDEGALELVYAPDTALITAGSIERRTATSSVSAPGLVAGMLGELDLAPGRRVLEIGAGSGYHAALMAAIVGDPALVTTVDIDPALVAGTRRRLDALGLGALRVECADGDDGFAPGAPYDRIVATVGCADISPAWADQLAAGGRLLVPVVHGVWHPRLSLAKVGDTLEGRLVGQSGFVAIQGAQAGASPWSAHSVALPFGTRANRRSVPLPDDLRRALAGGASAGRQRAPAVWDLGLYLALRDARAGFGACLTAGDATAGVHDGRLVVGPGADELAAALLQLGRDWVGLGSPAMGDYTVSFVPRPSGGPVGIEASPAGGPWRIRRLRHDQTVILAPAS